ncbi:hypothetical protein Bca52824_090091 [Brassica carinata]|uniref:Uncharacterized protein n=1 Tax=Brassica carinata TaxID=52824 RepID=A0A8X7NU22_BRACI|nr:hypothetical protein Bca52824_090091 [Brassica carinata]
MSGDGDFGSFSLRKPPPFSLLVTHRQKVPDNHLPLRLFATALYPCGRLNIYSKLDLLAFIHYALRDTEEFETIKASCFGSF